MDNPRIKITNTEESIQKEKEIKPSHPTLASMSSFVRNVLIDTCFNVFLCEECTY
jgi:hypothetical protein